MRTALRRLPSLASRIGLTLAVVAIVIGSSAEVAIAKVLPVASIDVATPNPTAGSPIRILVRFGEKFDLPDAAWENFEVSVVSSDRTGPSGWPLDRDKRGTPVPLRRVAQGTYRGSVVLARAGSYVVFAWSSVYAREARSQGVVTKFPYASPLRFLVRNAPAASAEVRAHGRGSPAVRVAFAASAALLTIGACIALFTTRTRARTRRGCPAVPRSGNR